MDDCKNESCRVRITNLERCVDALNARISRLMGELVELSVEFRVQKATIDSQREELKRLQTLELERL